MVIDAPPFVSSSFYAEQQTAAAAESAEEERRRIYQVTDGLKSPDTKRTYRHAFKHFIDITAKNDDLQALIDTKPSVIESKIISHIEYLKDVKKLKYWSIQVYCAAILHFFEMNDVILNTKKIKRFLPADEGHYQGDRPYSTNEIEVLLSKCDVRSRVIILLMTSTGMRIGGLPGLRLSDIKKMDEFGLYLVYVYNQSKKDRYYTFTTPECAKAIDDYLEFRKRCGEELNDKKSPLLRSKVTLDNPFTAKAPKPTTVRAIQLIIEGLLKQAGLPVGNSKQIMRTHGFRKWYANQCSRAQVDYPTREYLIGHRLPGQEPSYNRMTEEDRLSEYVKAIPFLTIDPTQRLKQENQELRKTQKDYLAELGDLRHEFDEMKQLLVHLSKESQRQLVDEFFQKVGDKADIEWSCD
jgi:integrase